MKNKQTMRLAGLGFALLLAGFIFYLYQSSMPSLVPATPAEPEAAQANTGVAPAASTDAPLVPAHVPEGWKVYSNNELNRFMGGIAFAYPSHWELTMVPTMTAEPIGGSNISGVIISGDGYQIAMVGHGGVPDGMIVISNSYKVAGVSAKLLQREVKNGYEQAIGPVGEFSFRIKIPVRNTELSDRILSTISISKK